jgi:hypothetical protein
MQDGRVSRCGVTCTILDTLDHFVGMKILMTTMYLISEHSASNRAHEVLI